MAVGRQLGVQGGKKRTLLCEREGCEGGGRNVSLDVSSLETL